MPLTSQISRDTPIKRFFQEHFPFVTGVVREINANAPPLAVQPPLVSNSTRIMLGTAFDYRARMYFPGFEPGTSTVTRGLHMLKRGLGEERSIVGGSPPLGAFWLGGDRWRVPGEVDEQLACELYDVMLGLANNATPGERLGQTTEDQVNKACVALACLDGLGRGFGTVDTNPLVSTIKAGSSKPEAVLHALTRHHGLLDDLRALSWLFHERWRDLLSGEANLEPMLAGASDVGGAEPDIVVDEGLYDWKTLSKGFTGRDVRQLLGYLLLDYDDALGIRSVGLYSVRRGYTWSTSTEEFLAQLSGSRASLNDWRRRLLAALSQS